MQAKENFESRKISIIHKFYPCLRNQLILKEKLHSIHDLLLEFEKKTIERIFNI